MGLAIQAIVEVALVQDDGSLSWDSACEWMFGKDGRHGGGRVRVLFYRT